MGKPEVSYFVHSLVNENVGHFDIPVNNVFLGQVLQPFVNIKDDGVYLFLFEVACFFQPLLEVAPIA